MESLNKMLALSKEWNSWNTYDFRTIDIVVLYGPNFQFRFNPAVRNIREDSVARRPSLLGREITESPNAAFNCRSYRWPTA